MECQINTIPRQQITFVRADACDEDAIQREKELMHIAYLDELEKVEKKLENS